MSCTHHNHTLATPTPALPSTRTLTLSQHTHMQHKQQSIPSSKSEIKLIILQININGIKANSRSSNCSFTTHIQILSQFRKPSSPLNRTHQTYITSPPCVPIGCTKQEVGSLLSLEATLYSLQHTSLRPSIHTTQNFKWSWYTLTTLYISQLHPFIYLLDTAHPRTTKQLTRTYNTAYSTSLSYHTQSSPEM